MNNLNQILFKVYRGNHEASPNWIIRQSLQQKNLPPQGKTFLYVVMNKNHKILIIINTKHFS